MLMGITDSNFEIGHINRSGEVCVRPNTGSDTSSHKRAFGEESTGTAHFHVMGNQV